MTFFFCHYPNIFTISHTFLLEQIGLLNNMLLPARLANTVYKPAAAAVKIYKHLPDGLFFILITLISF